MNRFQLATVALVGLATGLTGCAMTPLNVAGLFANKSKEVDSKMAAGLLFESQDKDEQAQRVYETMIEKDPRIKGVRQRLGVLAAKRGDYEEAEQHFAKALEEGPASAELLNDIGYNLFLQDKVEEAEEQFRKALKKDPHYKAAHTNLGLALGQLGKMDESLTAFRKGGSEAEAQANIAYIFAQRNQLVEAQMHYSLALKADPDMRPAAEALLQLSTLENADTRLAAATAEATGEAPVARPAKKNDIARSFDRGMGLVDIVDSTRPAPQVAQLAKAARVGKPADAAASVATTTEVTKTLENAAPVTTVAAANPASLRASRHIDRTLELPEAAEVKLNSGYRPSTGEPPRAQMMQTAATETKISELPVAKPSTTKVAMPQTPKLAPPKAIEPSRSSASDLPPAPPATVAKSEIQPPDGFSVPASRMPNVLPPNVLPNTSQAPTSAVASQVQQASYNQSAASKTAPPKSPPQQPTPEALPARPGQVTVADPIQMPKIVVPDSQQPVTPGVVTSHQTTSPQTAKPAVRRRPTTISAN
jgi:Tfp pilus assembly protein PilF